MPRLSIDEQLNFHSNILSYVSNSVIVFDKKGKVIYWNKGAEEIFGFTEKEMLGKTTERLYESDGEKQIYQNLRTLDTKGANKGEWRGIRKDGKTVWIDYRTSKFYNSDEVFVGYIAIANDITAQKIAQENLAFLARASKQFASSLDINRTLQSVSDLAVQTLADWCAVDFYKGDHVELVAVSHKDPRKVKWAYDLRKANPPSLNEKTGLAKVLKEGTIEYYPLLTDEFLAMAARNKKEYKLLKDIGFRSLMIVPIFIKGKAIAAITFVSSTYKRLYTEDDLKMAEELASRAALAIDNANLYHIAETERERLNNLLSNVPGVVWEAYGKPDEADQRINFVSDYVETMLGYTVQEWLNTPNFWLNIVHPDDKIRAAKESEVIFLKGKKGVSRFRWLTKKGKEIWVESQSTVIKDQNGNPIGMRGVTMDISQRVLLEQKKDEFISIASHELKTPLTSVKGYLQILERRLELRSDDKVKKLVEKTNIHIDRLNKLISDLLDVSKIQAGKMQFEQSEFDIYDVVNDSVDTIQSHSESHKIIIQNEEHYKVSGDKERIEQVITNLLTNAIKYSPSSKNVYVFIERKNAVVQVNVRDEGIGIPKESVPKLFQRFYRVESSSSQFSGLGIGLYISAQIIKRHGGDIWVESQMDKGSTFSFSLPLQDKNGKKISVKKIQKESK